jgi:hypothetical protein
MSVERSGNNSQAQALQRIFNHAFDGQARSKGLRPDELFQNLLATLARLRMSPSLPDILLACQKAEQNHLRLAQMGHLPMDAAERANEAVFDLLGRFIEHIELKELS